MSSPASVGANSPTRILGDTDSPHRVHRNIPVEAVKLNDGFWKPRLEANVQASIPALFEMLEEHGVLDNFRRIYGASDVPRRGYVFTDSDIYKLIEASAWTLAGAGIDASSGGPQLNGIAPELTRIWKFIDSAIRTILPAQGPDGYLNTSFVDDRAQLRWTRLEHDHELYCAGHLFQAAIALVRTTGDRRLLDCSIRFADLLCSVFGPGKLETADGHPEVELALVELYRETGERRYLDLAGFFLKQAQILDRAEIEGHAVRASYFCAGAADYAAETGDKRFVRFTERQWADLTGSKLYITGGAGGRYEGESLGKRFELPNQRAYAETCAALSAVFWNWRMLSFRPEARFADEIERTLYNGFLSGVSLSGAEYFYMNPLQWDGRPERDPWYAWARKAEYVRTAWHACTCCPPNIQRMFASLPGYFFGETADGLWVHLYDNAELNWTLIAGANLRLRIETAYPWNGDVSLIVEDIDGPTEFSIFTRIPAWCASPSARVVGDEQRLSPEPGTHLQIRRKWRAGDRIELNLPMDAVMMESDVRVVETRGSVAIQRGPIVYCVESSDNPRVDLLTAAIRPDAAITPKSCPHLLGGVVALEFDVENVTDVSALGPLYRRLGSRPDLDTDSARLTAIPYYAWCNRGPASMSVWLRLAKP